MLFGLMFRSINIGCPSLEKPSSRSQIPVIIIGIYAMFQKLLAPALAVLMLTSLGACGYSPGHRALTGGAIGAGGGALLGSATGLGAGTGALIGAGVGAGSGAATARQ